MTASQPLFQDAPHPNFQRFHLRGQTKLRIKKTMVYGLQRQGERIAIAGLRLHLRVPSHGSYRHIPIETLRRVYATNAVSSYN